MRLAITLLCLLLPLSAWAEPDDALLTDLQTKAESIRSISCDFKQEKHLSMFDEVLTSTGHFAFQKPASLRWEYTTPFCAGFLLQDGKGMEWDAASEKERNFTLASSPAMAMVSRQILAWTTFDIAWLNQQYNIKQLGANPTVLQLTPRGEIAKDFLAHLIVSFAPDNGSIKCLEIREIDGDFTRILFTAPTINSALPPETFTTVQ